MWKRFDVVSVIAYSGYMGRRTESLAAELAAVGIDAVWHWTVGTPIDALVLDVVPHCGMLEGRRDMINSLLGHYQAVKVARTMGADHALFLEDDVRFLRDRELLGEIVDGMPSDYDLSLLDWWERAKATDEEYAEMNAAELVTEQGTQRPWKRFENLRSAACYALSRRGMDVFVKMVEDALCRRPHGKLRITDQFWPRMVAAGLNGYCAWPCAAVQGYSDGRSMSNMTSIWKRYGRHGIERGNYDD